LKCKKPAWILPDFYLPWGFKTTMFAIQRRPLKWCQPSDQNISACRIAFDLLYD